MPTTFNFDDITALPQRYRVNLINSLSGFKSANLIGTISTQKQTNLAIISSTFHLGADPALIGFINRPHSVARHTLENILETGVYTLNHVNTDIIEAAHQTSARYDREESEFDKTGLDCHWVEGIPAPFVAQSHVRVGLRYIEQHTLLNNTVMIIGEVIYIEIPSQSLEEDGLINISSTQSVAVSGLDTYHSPNKLMRLSYAKPDTWPSSIK